MKTQGGHICPGKDNLGDNQVNKKRLRTIGGKGKDKDKDRHHIVTLPAPPDAPTINNQTRVGGRQEQREKPVKIST